MITIPLEIIHLQDDGFHILVEVVVFGQSFKAVLDTGASKTVFDKNTIEQYVDKETLLLSDKLSTGLGTNSMESHELILPEWCMGNFKLQDTHIAVLDLSMINHAYQMLEIGAIIGVIGGDILMQYGAVIDYPQEKLFFQSLPFTS